MTPHSIPLPDSSKPFAGQDPAVLFAMCLFGEARGDSDLARRAVAQVVVNRTRHPHPVFGSRQGAEFAENLRRVILRPGQFSSLSAGDPNYGKLSSPLEHDRPEVWERCLRCAEAAIAERDREDSLTANSDHYFDDSILPPAWASPAKQTVKIGRLNFYRLYLPSPASAPEGLPHPAGLSSHPAPSPLRGDPPPAPRRGAAAEPGNSVLDPSSGSRPHAKVSAASGRDAIAPEPHPLRSLMSHPAPKSPSALICGPRPYPRYDWSRGLSLLALLGMMIASLACSDLERTAYRVLAITQAEYETTQRQVAEAAAQGLITEDQWNRFQAEGHRFIAAHNAAVDAFQLWSQTKSKDDTARVRALLDVLPRLVAEINTLVGSFDQLPKPALEPDPDVAPAGLATASIRFTTGYRNSGWGPSQWTFRTCHDRFSGYGRPHQRLKNDGSHSQRTQEPALSSDF
jgi:cell wall hydrolase